MISLMYLTGMMINEDVHRKRKLQADDRQADMTPPSCRAAYHQLSPRTAVPAAQKLITFLKMEKVKSFS